MTVIDALRIIRRARAAIVLCAVAGVAVAGLWTLTLPVVYTASANGYVIATAPGGSVYDAQSATTFAAQRVQQYLPLAETKTVATEMGTILQAQQLTAAPITAAIVPGSSILRVESTGTSPEEAQARANAGIQAMANVIHKMETLQPSAAEAQDAGSLDKMPSGGTPSVALVNFEPAVLPSRPSSPDWPTNLLLGLAAGLLLGVAGAVARRVVDSRIRTKEDVEHATKKSVLGVIPRTPELGKQRKRAADAKATGMASEALRKLRTNLRFAQLDKPLHSIVVTSPNPGEGKSTVSANLARVLAESGQRVVLIDADLRKPMQARAFHLDGRLGLTEVLTGDVSAEEALQDSGTPRLRVLTAGRIPPNPSEVVGSQAMAQLIEDLAQHYFVIVDAPPLLPVTDAGLIAAVTDGTLLVVRVANTHKEQAGLAAEALNQVGGNLLGTVVNGASRRQMGEVVYGYGKDYGYGSSYYYGYDPKGERERRERDASASSSIPGGPRLAPYQRTADASSGPRRGA